MERLDWDWLTIIIVITIASVNILTAHGHSHSHIHIHTPLYSAEPFKVIIRVSLSARRPTFELEISDRFDSW